MQNFFLFFLLSVSSFALEARQLLLGPSENSSEKIQEALIEMQPGDVLTLEPGEYFFEDGISLDIDDVIFEGSGINDTILNFGNQISGAQGLFSYF